MANELCSEEGHVLKEVKSLLNKKETVAVFWNVCARCGDNYGHTSFDIIPLKDGTFELKKNEGNKL